MARDTVPGINPRWTNDVDGLRRAFAEAQPFPLLVLDDFLELDLAEQLLSEFPAIDAMPRSRDYVFGSKHELSSVEASGAAGRRFHQVMVSDGFRHFLRATTGFEVFVDEQFFGGGFHQGGDGSFLDMHVDFNVHPLHKEWLRTLNILVYLNKDWKPEYDGRLLVKAAPDDEPREIEPVFNRAVIMLTDDHTFHGYRRMSLPAGVTRKSIAAYAYQAMKPDLVKPRTTGWVPESASWSKRFLARHYDRAVKVKNRFFGSGTAKNR